MVFRRGLLVLLRVVSSWFDDDCWPIDRYAFCRFCRLCGCVVIGVLLSALLSQVLDALCALLSGLDA